MNRKLAFDLIEKYLHEHEGCIPIHDVVIYQNEVDGLWETWTYNGLKQYLSRD